MRKMFLHGCSRGLRSALLLCVALVFTAFAAFSQDAAPTPEIRVQAASPVTIGIVVDNSGSYRTIFDRVVSSTNTIIQDVRPGDEGFFVTFVDTPKISLRQELTRDITELRDASDNMFIEGGQTAVLDAVMFAAKYMIQQAGSEPNRSRVIVLITDGDDRGSAATVEEAIAIAKEAKTRVLVLGLFEEKFYSKVIDRLIRETGGAKFVPKFPKDTPAAVANLLAAIRSK